MKKHAAISTEPFIVITENTVLYKYRGLSNLQFALDIFINHRLHAARYKDLNDPMEGQYNYINGTLEPWQRDEIFGQKNQYRLVALSENFNNVLMWGINDKCR